MGTGLKFLGHFEAAIRYFREALALDPGFADAHANLASTFFEQGRLEDAYEHYQEAMRLRPDSARIRSNFLLALHYSGACTPEEILASHRRYDAQHALPFAVSARPFTNEPTPDRRIRVGYVSPDFRAHSVAFFLEPLLAAHDRRRVEVFCYANVPLEDAVTVRLRAMADHWQQVYGMSDEDLAALIRRDNVDVLVDLAGHTAGSRLLVFARKPAPIQVTYLGYPATTGLSAIGYRLTDAWADPVGWTELLHTEQLVRLPAGFLCYRPSVVAPPVAPLPAVATGRISFASFNDLSKITPDVLTVWSAILRAVPNARIVLKATGLDSAETQARILDTFLQHGVGGDRVELSGRTKGFTEHLARYHNVDIGLDPFPYNGTTTTCEALWMGVPVVSLEGRTHVSRVGVSLLSRLGLEELIAKDRAAYVDLAARVAGDLNRLGQVRSELRDRMGRSSLTDASLIASTVEEAYRAMWRAWCERQVPHVGSA